MALLQDSTPYDSFLLGINNLYIPFGKDKFFINTPFVESNFDMITTGKTYVVVHADNTILTIKFVKLIDVVFDNIMMNIFLRDLFTGQRIHLEFDIHKREDLCPFKLVELDYLQKKMDFLGDTVWNKDK